MTGKSSASELARRLAEDSEAVCREYLSYGRRCGNYWIVGDVRNTPGRSMHVRLKDTPKGPAGKWVDEATAEYGDLLDVIRESCGLVEFRDVADEARRFLSLPRPSPSRSPKSRRASPLQHPALPTPPAACSPWRSRSPVRSPSATCRPAAFRSRRASARCASIPAAIIAISSTGETLTLPALIAAITSFDGHLTGVQRTFLSPIGLDPDGVGKARVADPRRSLGNLLGNGIRLGFDAGCPSRSWPPAKASRRCFRSGQ